MFSSIVTLSPLTLEPGNSVFRKPPRPINQQQPDYLEKFDSQTIFYDAFHDGENIRFSGPPLLNLAEYVGPENFQSGHRPPIEGKFCDLDRTQSSWIRFDHRTNDVLFTGLGIQHKLSIGESFLDVMTSRNVLVTKSKNNDLEWIRDWIKFHVEVQEINAVLLYDNSSSDYDSLALMDMMRKIEGLEVGVVVEWPFKFGPQGGNWEGMNNAPWDSDFTEYSILEHARHRFLKKANLVISADIDELVMSNGGQSVLHIIDELQTGGIAYSGRWINNVLIDENLNSSGTTSFGSFGYFDPREAPTTQKWSILPRLTTTASQWKTHSLAGYKLTKTDLVTHRHFRGISNNWKTARSKPQQLDTSHHIFDHVLSKNLVESGIRVSNDPAEDASSGNFLRKPILTYLADGLNGMRFDFQCGKAFVTSDNCIEFQTIINGRTISITIDLIDDKVVAYIRLSDSNSQWIRALFANRSLSLASDRVMLLTLESDVSPKVFAESIFDQVRWISQRNYELLYPQELRREESSTAVPTYWWNGRTNFGDLIGPMLVGSITGRPVKNMKDSDMQGSTLVTVGSVLNLMERERIDIWGTGLIAPLHSKSIANLSRVNPRQIHAVRGWRTYKELTQKMGWVVPRVFGDPALLLPRFYRPSADKASDTTVIPHYMHAKYFTDMSQDLHVVNVESTAEEVISVIANSRNVVSTSLHGIIVAQAYGIPWTWLRIEDQVLAGDQFKFEDFFSVIDRDSVSSFSIKSSQINAGAIRSVSKSSRVPSNKFNFNALLDAFPSNFEI
ncbi:polysaccharide pyruvyl transferase family protein [Glutamicibacter sp. NPDC087344]|uniref:polysaccharide pyruvyl transferase family protein n=1 Tax=Glutamicibacter sp. NPDC087344 TaxID=3363994 RepID=UPI0038150D9B